MTPAPIRKAYVDTPLAGGSIQTHYRTAGEGMPLVVLHPSPMSSAFMAPVINTVSDLCHVLAPDTPGYGGTDPLPQPGDDLAPYVDWLRAYVDALGLDEFLLYGSATGAQIAIEFAHAHAEPCAQSQAQSDAQSQAQSRARSPTQSQAQSHSQSHRGRLKHLLLDNAVHFTDAERAEIMARYFPDIAPRADGGHLADAWSMAQGLFRGFPWYEEPEQSLPEPPLSVVQATVLAYLVAGEDYARAYKAAFNNERAERVQSLTVSTTVLRWSGSLLRPQADRLDGFEWPEHIVMKHSEAAPEARFKALREAVEERL